LSSAVLEILDKDLKVIGYGEYYGTSDTVPPEFVIDYEKEMAGQKPGFLGWPDKECEHDDNIDVILLSNYGGESYWPSKACMKCKVITGITSPYEPDYGYGSPTDEQRKPYTELYKKGYPKDGNPFGTISSGTAIKIADIVGINKNIDGWCQRMLDALKTKIDDRKYAHLNTDDVRIMVDRWNKLETKPWV
jgi:hypothetical protein